MSNPTLTEPVAAPGFGANRQPTEAVLRNSVVPWRFGAVGRR